MIGFLGFVLELAALGSVVGITASVVVFAVWRLLPTRRLAPAVRSDLAFLAGVVPALASLAIVLAAAAPSLVVLLGGTDHCLDHGHHLHICIVHAESLRPPLAFLGAVALGSIAWRLGAFLLREVRAASRLRALVALATRPPAAAASARFPTLWLPGAPRLCHAAGVIRPRIVISRSLAETLSPELLRAAIAHEEAHLVRRDPLARLILCGAGVFALPRIARALELAFRDASEEACDASAARNVGDPFVVADALVSVARLQLASASGLLAFGASTLERRVRALIDGVLEVRSSKFLGGLALAALLAAAIAGPHHGAIHHTVETLLSKAF